MTYGRAIVCIHGLASMSLAIGFGSTPLITTVLVSNLLGLVYSVPLPLLPARWKRYPAMAAGCIVAVRSLLVQIGFHEHLRAVVGPATVQPWYENDKVLFSVVFFLAMGIVIALFKDVPDIAGDKQANINTFAVRQGAQSIVNLCALLVAAAFAGAVVYWAAVERHYVCAAGHALAGWWLRRKLLGTTVKGKEAAKSIRSSYMAIWRIFFVEYLLLMLSLY